MNEELKKVNDVHKKQMEAIQTIMGSGCQHCDNKGRVIVANGEDDFDFEFCDCPKGEELKKKYEDGEI